MTQNEILKANKIVLANAVELGYQAICKIAGNGLSDQVHGEHISETVRDILVAKINMRLAHHKKSK